MATHIRPLELEVLCAELQTMFGALIQGQGADELSRRRNFFSRALPAFVLHHHAGATLEQAVAASVDGGHDHGLDSVFVGADLTIWLLQSKYKDAGIGEPDLAEVAEFCDGVEDLLRGRWERFNASLQGKAEDLNRALGNEGCRVRVLLVHTGGAISDDRRQKFADLERAFNAAHEDFVRCDSYGLTTVHGIQLDAKADEPIDVELTLSDFGFVAQPVRAFYGRLSAKRLAELWMNNGDTLVERNIRRFKGSTEVNAGLSATLQQHGEHFFYFNNGVTFLCNSFAQIHGRDPDRQQGQFRVRGLSIINGAQTVGAIAREPLAHYDAHPSEVLATFVCLENAPDGFGGQVTQYRNRQNAVDLEDFAALDEKQQHWRRTLSLAGVEYIYKRGEDDPPTSASVFMAREAAPALACCVTGRDWAEFVVAAKSDRKRLFRRSGLRDAGGPEDAYSRIFSESLTAKELWRTVQIGRAVDQAFTDRASSEQDPQALAAGLLRAADILREGRWLALHIILLKTGLRQGEMLALSDAERQRISTAVDAVVSQLVAVAQDQQWGKQARAVFENRADCAALKTRLMQAIPQAL